jgi:galactokinase
VSGADPTEAVRRHLGGAARTVRSPGRVNLIGGQVDYHEGIVVSAALDLEVVVGFTPRSDTRVRVRSLDLGGVVEVAADGRDLPEAVEPRWGRLVASVVRALARRDRPPAGLDAVVATTLPIGAGLSSSAAFEVALALTLDAAAGVGGRDRRELARACQEAEHEATGVPCGIQDQLTCLFGTAGAALAIDCRDLAIRPVPLPAGLRIAVVHSGVPRALAASPWATRRAESLAVASALGLRVLRDAAPGQVAGEPRGRHVVSEIARAAAFAEALAASDVGALGPLLLASHASSRDDMEVSTPELDALVGELVRAGALGARLTGGGFGGCVVALVAAGDAERVVAEASSAYRAATGREPRAWIVTPAGAAALRG